MPAPGGGGADRDDAVVAVGSGGGVGAMGEAEAVAAGLKAERMNRTVTLPDCSCIRQPRVVSYAEVGDPNGFVVSPAHNKQSSSWNGATVLCFEGRRSRVRGQSVPQCRELETPQPPPALRV